MKQIRKRLTYANVMSSMAVFLVLGGGAAVAASKIGADQLKANSVKTGKIVKEAITASKLKTNAVTSVKIADGAVTGAKADEASFAQVPSAKAAETAKTAETAKLAETANTANTAKTAETAKVAGSASNVLWAVVDNPAGVANTTLARSSQPAPTVTESTGVIVEFNRNISGCAWIVSRGTTGEGVEVAGFAEVGGADGNPNAVDVRTRDSDGGITDGDFHLQVICP